MPDGARFNIGRSLFTIVRMTDTASQADIESFIARWQASQAAERANYQLFLSELCDMLGVARPEPAGQDDARNAYIFERAVTFQNGDGTTSTGRIDLYKRGSFVNTGSFSPAVHHMFDTLQRYC